MSDEPLILEGFVDGSLVTEFGGLRISYCLLDIGVQRSPREVRDQLSFVSNRVYGERAIEMRREPITHAYRVFFRHIGLDPDETRTPFEATIVERLRAGRFSSEDLVFDACTIAIIESGAALMAFDAAELVGPVGLRPARDDEKVGGVLPVAAGTIVVGDADRAFMPLFDEPAGSARRDRSTARTAVCAVAVDGVAPIMIEEALWKCVSIVNGV